MTGSPARYDLLSHVHAVVADAAEHAAREAGLGLLDVQRGEGMLEIGCGTGRVEMWGLPVVAAVAEPE